MHFSLREDSGSFIVICLIFSLFAAWPPVQPHQANVLEVHHLELGNLFSENPSAVQMTYASVFHNITYSSSRREFVLFFSGSYVLFNPDASFTTELAMPFASVGGIPFPMAGHFQVNVSNEPTPVRQVDGDFFFADSSTRKIFELNTNFIQLLLFNATLEAQVETEIKISLYGTFSAKWTDGITFYYIVGSARAWSGTVTEIVQFLTWDVLPTSFRPEENALVSTGDQNHRRWGNYSWFFLDQRIAENSLEIFYSIPRKADSDESHFLEPILVLLGVILASISRRMKKRNLTENGKGYLR